MRELKQQRSKMMMLTATSLVVIVLSLCSREGESVEITDVLEYRLHLGNFLADQVETDALAANVIKANEWLTSLGPEAKVRPSILELHNILSLLNKVCTQDYFCGRDGIYIFKLLQILDVKGGRPKLDEKSQRAERRIHALLSQARQAFGIHCRLVAMNMMASISSNMNEKVASRVESFFGHVKRVSGSPSLYSDLATSTVKLLTSFHITHTASNLAHGALEAILDHEEDSLVQSLSSKDSKAQDLLDLFKIYIDFPCTEYLKLMQRPMEMIQFDELFMMEHRAIGSELDNFKEIIEMYETCAQTRTMKSPILLIVTRLVSDRANQRVEAP